MNIDSKRIRLLWNEFISPENTLYPSLSFDNGLSWTDLKEDVEALRNGNSKGISINKATEDKTTGLTKVDFSAGFSPYCVPNIVDIKCSLSSEQTNFVGGTTYYFAVTSTNYDVPGLYKIEDNAAEELYNMTFEEAIQEIDNDPTLTDAEKTQKKNELRAYAKKYHIYYEGSCNKNNLTDKKLQHYSKVMTVTTDNVDGFFNIDLYVNYSYLAEGINVYCGTNINDMKLIYISNLTQSLKSNLGSSEAVDNTIYLNNKFPFPYKGVVKIDSEYIPYESCTYNSGWQLNVATGARKAELGLSSHNKGAVVYLVSNDEYKTRKPVKVYDYSKLDSSIKYYLNFNSSNSFEVVSKKLATVKGTATYNVFDTLYGMSYYIDGKSIIKMDYKDETETKEMNKEGSFVFNFVLTDFDKNSTYNPFIIYPTNDKGFYVRINRQNRKIEIGYMLSLDSYVVIFSSEDYRIPVLSNSKFNNIGLSWYKNGDTMSFVLNVDNGTKIELPSEIKATDFEFTELNIGGKNIDELFPIGYLDNFILFNTNISNSFKELMRKYRNGNSTTAGKIRLGYLFNATNMDGINSYNDKGSYTSNHLYDYTFTTDTLGDIHYEPKIHTVINNTTAVEPTPKEKPDDVEDENLYDNWLMYEYIKQDADGYSIFPSIAYPINPKTVQVKYKMGYIENTTNKGFTTPFLYNPSLIISSISVG